MERRWWTAAGRVLLSRTCGIFLGVAGLVAGAVVGGYIAQATEPAIQGGAHESIFESIGLLIRAMWYAIVGGFVGAIAGAVLGTLGGAWLGRKAVRPEAGGPSAEVNGTRMTRIESTDSHGSNPDGTSV